MADGVPSETSSHPCSKYQVLTSFSEKNGSISNSTNVKGPSIDEKRTITKEIPIHSNAGAHIRNAKR